MRYVFQFSMLAAASIAALSAHTVMAAEEVDVSRRWALLIGVNDYVDLADLNYAGRDAEALGISLEQTGFERDRIFLLHDDAKETRYRPFKANIEKQLDIVLKLAGPDDLVIVSFSGHGMHVDGKSFLCPSEANDADPARTMIAVDDVYAKFAACDAALKLLVVDACRNDPRPPTRKSVTPQADRKSFGATFERPPEGIIVLASCGPGQISYEDDNFKHGVFMHFLLSGLSGEADGNRNGRITLGELYDYASNETKVYVARAHNDFQVPAQRGEINGVFELPRISAIAPFNAETAHRHQMAAARYLKREVELTNGIGQKLVLLPAGEFRMGSPASDSDASRDEKPQHRVRITKAFYLGVHEVTRGQFAQFVSDAGYRTEAEFDFNGGQGYDATTGKFEGPKLQYNWKYTGWVQTDEHPVVNVSRNDATAFCNWLSRKEGKEYRLPTEAEWEFACRAGTTTKYYHGEDPEGLSTFGNVADGTAKAKFPDWNNSIENRDGYVFTAPVGRYKPNGFGIYDMTGNVWEWCDDGYDEEFYAQSCVDDPSYVFESHFHVNRGGSWFTAPADGRSANRRRNVPGYQSSSLGFRVALVP